MASYKVFKPQSAKIPSSAIEQQKVEISYNEIGIIKSGGTENSSLTIYTVPVGKVFIFLGFTLQNGDNAPGGQCYLKVGGVDVAGILGLNAAVSNPIVQMSLPQGIVYPAGTQFIVRSEMAGSIAYATIHGTESNNLSLYK